MKVKPTFLEKQHTGLGGFEAEVMVSLDPRHHSEEWPQKCLPVGLWHNDLAIFGADLLSDVDTSDGAVIDDVNKVVQKHIS